jgi:hypothetical protein
MNNPLDQHPSIDGELFPPKKPVQSSMQSEEKHLETIERVRKQSALLLRLYRAELANDPTSRGTESSRSNLMALRHTIAQMYGDA